MRLGTSVPEMRSELQLFVIASSIRNAICKLAIDTLAITQYNRVIE